VRGEEKPLTVDKTVVFIGQYITETYRGAGGGWRMLKYETPYSSAGTVRSGKRYKQSEDSVTDVAV
jgi:hypothetical protein